MRGLRHAALLLLAQLSLLSATAGPALAAHVTLTAKFEPDISGHSTTILYKFTISKPLPVEFVDLHLPAGLELATSSLGLSECNPMILLEEGPGICPANSIVGRGTAFAEVPLRFNPYLIKEQAYVTAVLGSPTGEDPTVLFYVEGRFPVFSKLVLPSVLSLSSGRFSAALTTPVPLITAWAEGPDISLTRFEATIGPRGVTYYHRRHGHLIPFHPKGLSIPRDCPSTGFPFRVEFRFYNGTTAAANAYAPCPQDGSRRSRREPRRSQ